MPTINITCEWCGKQSEKYVRPDRPPKRFCDRTCSARWRMSRPEYVAAMHAKRNTPEQKARDAERFRAVRKRPDVQEKLAAHLNGSTNPFRDPEVQAKGRLAAAASGYPGLTGGNGRGWTVPQTMLLYRLGYPEKRGVVPEHPITTGRGRPYPASYKVDIALPEYRLAIELDGNSHNSAKAKERDQKKDDLLRLLGWTVLRFPNKQVLSDLESIMQEILRAAQLHVRYITSRLERGTM